MKSKAFVVCAECKRHFTMVKNVRTKRKSESFVRYAESLERPLCMECFRAKRKCETELDRESEYEASLKVESELGGLTPLKGSEKQIRWATTIRAGKLLPLSRMSDYASAIGAIAAAHSESSWWIEHRNLSRLELVDAVALEWAETNGMSGTDEAKRIAWLENVG